MPAARAIASVEAPSNPWFPNSVSAASRTASRRSPAVFRSVACAFTVSKLSLTYYVCQGLCDTIEVGIRQLRVKRQGECALEGVVGAGKWPLVGVGGKVVQRVRADLGLDPPRAQPLEH